MGSSIGGLVGGIAGSFLPIPGVGTALGSAAGSLIGGALGGGSAQTANQNQAQALSGAGSRAAQGAMFRPVGVTTNFGSSNFQVDPATGQLTSAGYNLSPQLQSIQNSLLGTASNYNPTQYANASQNLFNLGQGYLATSPQQAATDYYNQQSQLLAPGRERALADVQNQQFQTGRSGLGVGGTRAGYTAGGPGLMQANPQLAALYNAQAQQDADLAAKADLYGQQRTQFGLGLMNAAPGLFSAGYSPLTTLLNTANSVEGMGQNAMSLGSSLGAQQSTAGAQAGRLSMAGAELSAPYGYRAQSYNPMASVLQGQTTLGTQSPNQVNNWFNGIIGSTPTTMLSNEVSKLGSSTWNPFSDYNTGANGWGNYGE